MKIEKGVIELNNSFLRFGMNFSEVENKINDVIYVKKEIDEKGLGHIIIKNESFYGLFGTSTLYFINGVLAQISIIPEWNKYNLNDANGNRLPIDQAVDMIATLSENGLRNALGEEKEKSDYGNLLFVSDDVCIVTARARSGEQYSVIIKLRDGL